MARSKPARRKRRSGKPEPMYARITGISVLDHETRHDMLRMITSRPGASFKEIQDRCGLADGPTSWHLEKLSREGFVSLVRDGKVRRYFPRQFPQKLARTITALSTESRRSLLLLVAANEGATQAELAALAGLSPPTALHHLEILESLGLVASWRESRSRRYQATSAGRDAIQSGAS